MSSIQLPCSLPLDISPQHALEYEQIAMAVRDQTIALYGKHLSGCAIFDPSQWKRVKTRESVNVYGTRDRHPTSAYHEPLDPSIASPEVRRAAEWAPQIKLRLLGQTLGLVDDAMYGTTATTEISMMMRSASNNDEFVDHRNLLEIHLPTEDEPFTYTGLKWSVRSTYIASLIKARDMTHIESTGFTTVRHNGMEERVGYIVYHSVNLPQLPPLSSQGIIRSRFSVCTLFRQAGPNVVEIFSTTSLFPGGELPHKVTAIQAADALFAVCKMTESAMKKKLVWMQAARAYGAPNATSEYLSMGPSPMRQSFSDNFHRTSCDQCHRVISALRSVTMCEICTTCVCSRCLTTQKLVYGDAKHDVHVKSVRVCKGCIATAKRMDNAAALAVYEFVQPFDAVRKQHAKRLSSAVPVAKRAASTASETRSETTSETVGSFSDPQPARERQPSVMRATSDDVMLEHKLRLWRQINELCLQAEETYRQTKQQAQLVDIAYRGNGTM